MDQISWHTAHNVKIDLPLASIGNRIVAYIVDYVIKIAFVIALFFFLSSVFEDFPPTIVILFLAIPFLFYSFLFELWNDGQTPGKKACHIKVTSTNGQPAGAQAFFLRWIFRIIDFDLVTPAIGLIAAALSSKRQRIGDLVAGTVVIHTRVNTRYMLDTYTKLPQDYEPLYPAAQHISRHNIAVIKDVLKMEMGPRRDELVEKMYEKVLHDYHIHTEEPPRRFLFSLVKDYNYYLLRM